MPVIAERVGLAARTDYRRSMVLVTGASMLVPVVGVATAPILAHALGVEGRGEAGAAMGPNLFIVGGASLGLEHALTYLLAKRAHLSRVALWWAVAVAGVLGSAALLAFVFLVDRLSGGDPELAGLMLVATAFGVPALWVGLLRGAAMGRQMWTAVAVERVLNSVLRLVAFLVLLLLGHLDVLSAVLVMSVVPLVSALAFWGLLRVPPRPPDEPHLPARRVARELVSFGSRVWLSSVAIMLMARMSQLLVTPLSSVEQLGLLLIAITISDIPYIVTSTIREFVFGTHSADADVSRLLAVSRTTTLLAVAGSAVVAATLPLWIDEVFGSGFHEAVVPTWILLASSCVAVPGLIAGAALDSAARPGLRSTAMLVALAVNVTGLLVLTPLLGAEGAAAATLTSTTASTVFMVVWAARVLETPVSRFVLPRGEDVALLRSSATAALRGLGRRARRL